MLKFLGILLVACIVLPLASCMNKAYIGRACYPDRAKPNVIRECVESELCDEDGTFVEDGADIINQRKGQTKAPIDCPSSLSCCLPTSTEPAATTAPGVHDRSVKAGCGWLQPGVGPALPGRAKPEEVPWIVGIYNKSGYDATTGLPQMEFLANGVLIHGQAVLTVAHKASGFPPAASVFCVFGDYNQSDTSQHRKAVRARAIRVHESFDNSTAEHNIALIVLETSAMGSHPQVAPVCLPAQGHEVTAGTPCFFTGWGKDTQDHHQALLSKTEVPVVSRATCATVLRPYLGLYFEVQPTLMCAGGVQNQDICTGDGGSPLVCPIQGQPGRYQLAGLVVYVAVCGPLGLPAVFTDVAVLRTWVDTQMTAEGLTLPSY